MSKKYSTNTTISLSENNYDVLGFSGISRIFFGQGLHSAIFIPSNKPVLNVEDFIKMDNKIMMFCSSDDKKTYFDWWEDETITCLGDTLVYSYNMDNSEWAYAGTSNSGKWSIVLNGIDDGLHNISFTFRSNKSCELTGRTTIAVSAPLR